MFYDIERIQQDAIPIGVAKYLKMKMCHSGKNIFIPCPDHVRRLGRHNRDISCCTLGNSFQNAYYCFGCGGKGNIFEMIAGYCDLDIKNDFYQILTMAAESCGGCENYQIKNPKDYKSKKKNKYYQSSETMLTAEQLSAIGLKQSAFGKIIVECYDDSQISDNFCFTKDVCFLDNHPLRIQDTSYLDMDTAIFSLSALSDKCPDLYRKMIHDHSKIAMEKYKRLATMDYSELHLDLVTEDELRNCYKQKYIMCNEVFKEYAGNEEYNDIDISWLYGYDDIQTEKEPGMMF